MIDSLFARAVLKALVLPPVSLLLIAAIGLLLARRRPRTGHALAWTGVIGLLLLSIPIVASLLDSLLDTTPMLDARAAKDAQAIVILGGGIRRQAPEYGGDTLGRLTLDRVRYGARVARSLHLPVLVTGGSLHGAAAEGRVMQDALENEFGVHVQWVEDRSRNTHENALRSADILRGAGVHRIVLVAHAFDMPRARAEFEQAGLEVVPAATGLASDEPITPADFVPSVAALQGSYYALYELLANRVR